MLPEEQELLRLETEQAELEEHVASAELALNTKKSKSARFRHRYYATVGRLYAQLDGLDAQLAEARAHQDPSNSVLSARAHSARVRARQSSAEAGVVEADPKPSEIGQSLKDAYRKAVKHMHPDLALADHERLRRTKLMALLNGAYERGDLQEIERLVEEFGRDPEAIIGEDVASRIVKAIRRIAQLRRRLGDLQRELEDFRQTEMFQLCETVETAEAAGRDPLGALAKELRAEIARREAELKTARNAQTHLQQT
jgi:hypothetical protein